MVRNRCSGRAAPNRRIVSAPALRGRPLPAGRRPPASGGMQPPARCGPASCGFASASGASTARSPSAGSEEFDITDESLPENEATKNQFACRRSRPCEPGLTPDAASPSHSVMTSASKPQSGRLLHLGLLRFTGPDSSSFLQGQVSNDTRRLSAGDPLLAAYSSPQGRVLAVMHLLPHSSGIAAILPSELVPPTLDRLRKFVLRAKVQMEDAG